MNDEKRPAASRGRYRPLPQLILSRVREFYREPEALFWVYGFPILMIVVLGFIIGTIVIALFMPLIKLLEGLSK